LRATDIEDQGPNPVALSVVLPGDLFAVRENGLSAAEIYDKIALLEALHHTGDHVTFAVLVFGKDILPFRVLYFLNDNLFGCLGCNSPEAVGLHFDAQLVADFRFSVEFPPRGLEVNLEG
jgi:hypothetical protein